MIKAILLWLLWEAGGSIGLPAVATSQPVETPAPAAYPFVAYNVYTAWMLQEKEEPISEYDDVLQRVGVQEGVDWRLLSAIAYHESRFRHHVVSSTGARGIMQVRPVVARHFNVPTKYITDVEINVLLAAKLLRAIEEGLKLPPDIHADDRMGLILACYNAGEAHVARARRRARASGHDADTWNDVSSYLGRRQTTAFVRKVIAQYEEYCDRRAIAINTLN